ncbi:ATP-binding protein [Microbacterium sp.]|uniref:ATP-binding protein n=1 Tax=Microbacterium sp. TaxID=51671 RepID=UPI0039E49F22
MDPYLPRAIDDELRAALIELPAVAINGPKGVGKTASAERLAATTVRLDDPAQRELFDADPNRLRAAARPMLIDEWQRSPQSWDAVRRWVDEGAPAGSVLLTGSAAPRGAAVHSGAGRIAALRMRPMSLAERALVVPTVSLEAMLAGTADITGESALTLHDYVEEITASGFPGIRRLSARGRAMQLDAYLDNVVQREFPDQGLAVRAPETLRRWLCAYAAATGTTASYAKILDAATPGESNKPAKTTTIAYRDVLHSLWLLDPLDAWAPGATDLGRLGQGPVHFLADPALACRLLGVDASDLREGAFDADPLLSRFGTGYGTLLGRLFEALVALSVQVYATHDGARVGHVRTRNGDHEVDLIVHRGRRVVALEVKLAPTVSDSDVRHLRWLRDRMGAHLADAAVITTGPVAYRRADGIAVIPAALLGP